jgi:outer membrane beta-barrel protein
MGNSSAYLPNRGWTLFVQRLVLLLACAVQIPVSVAAESDERFSNYEVRVIRPRFFQKTSRFELGAQLITVMNNTFVYTLMASGLLTYHFSETFAFETSAAFGYSIDRKDKETLKGDFKIKTEVFRTQYALEGALLWTPAYGKVQLPEGRLVYFDTFFALGAGMTGVEWRYSDMCVDPNRELDSTTPDRPSDATKSYPTVVYGLGQRIFRTRKDSFRWDIRGHTIMYNSGDASCNVADAGQGQTSRNNITWHLGFSRFF